MVPVGVDDMPVLAVIAPAAVPAIVVVAIAEPDAVVDAADCDPAPTPLAVPVMVTGNKVMSVELSCSVVDPMPLASLPPTSWVHRAWVTGEPVSAQAIVPVLSHHSQLVSVCGPSRLEGRTQRLTSRRGMAR